VVRLVAPAGVATGDASDRRLHFETVPTRALVLRRFPAQRPNPCEIFRRSPEGRSRPGASRLRARPREGLLLRAASPVRETSVAGTGKLGAARCKRGRGESRFTTRLSLRRPGELVWRSVLPPRGDASRSPLTLLSPPPTPRTASLFFESCARFEKPPRSDPRGPRERRALYRPGAPSAGSRRAQPARAEARTNPHDLPRSYDAHVMRIAALRRTAPLYLRRLLRLRAGVRPPVRLPFTRSTYRPGFRPDRYRWHASLSPRAFYRLLQYVRCTGTNLGDAASSFCGGGDSLSLPSPRPPPCGDGDGLTSRAIPRLRRGVSSRGPDQLE